jgi:tetratricopeptide (TPR) repeat protein
MEAKFVDMKQMLKTIVCIASLFIVGLLFKELLKMTDNKNVSEKSSILYAKGLEATDKGQYTEAFGILSKAVKLDSTNIHALNALGRVLYKMEKYTEVIEKLSVKTIDAGTLQIRGDAYFAVENYSAAFADYSESLKLSPNAPSFAGLGNIFMKMNNLPEGINNYTKAIDLKPNCAGYYFLRGKAFNLDGKYEVAINDFDEALKLEPDNVSYKQNRDFAVSLKDSND